MYILYLERGPFVQIDTIDFYVLLLEVSFITFLKQKEIVFPNV